ncbi:2,3,4,5-tetrahydropyridine-2,6-dicarboxylate N-acetyltransferase [Paenibacillus plantiphilus]|uniref:2,3,4,5-tetrahydropyridine-2,6-dicarboxylate N-acetyltransferase n=1 Tax=Paenibacillus plantiphilus TaxID=2905650 RepID=A0ABM9CAL4_9BACL|nr:acyltransferase [Paenibacillus plantiphilus]CAH1206844.1 2,3,4,5-tetrahydropyridine-2,6-dicarboxylate N-acetyltransferase [Paenibacillus plantiphilus]
MRGRDLFRSAKPLLNGFILVLRIVPKPLLVWMWTLSDMLPELVGVACRYCVLRRLARRCGDNVLVGRGVEIRYWERLSIGSNVSIHKQSYLDAYGELVIEDDVSIAHQSSLVSFQHTWSDESSPIRDNPVVCGKIRICRDVWIGCGVRVLAGVEIGSRTVIAAGAVVTRSIPGGVVAAGVPAKAVKAIMGEKRLRGSGSVAQV